MYLEQDKLQDIAEGQQYEWPSRPGYGALVFACRRPCGPHIRVTTKRHSHMLESDPKVHSTAASTQSVAQQLAAREGQRECLVRGQVPRVRAAPSASSHMRRLDELAVAVGRDPMSTMATRQPARLEHKHGGVASWEGAMYLGAVVGFSASTFPSFVWSLLGPPAGFSAILRHPQGAIWHKAWPGPSRLYSLDSMSSGKTAREASLTLPSRFPLA
ncbi:hypothetical protein BKA66DRAFT_567496 [Pyrenochaeta sp. MPI-SDFR-AT-0127]|nr:hypothetical protein BKA66DRAFT_567496 [Pyrenochaeta sp. MPI-SDFR-AT-0127]